MRVARHGALLGGLLGSAAARLPARHGQACSARAAAARRRRAHGLLIVPTPGRCPHRCHSAGTPSRPAAATAAAAAGSTLAAAGAAPAGAARRTRGCQGSTCPTRTAPTARRAAGTAPCSTLRGRKVCGPAARSFLRPSLPRLCPRNHVPILRPGPGTGYGYESERADSPGPDGAPGARSPKFNYEMVDQLRVPAETGAYVLSWRWDTEQKGQVWSGCADIVITE